MTAPIVLKTPSLTANQRLLLENPSRVVYVGCGTKTGKSLALGLWVVEGLLQGERCAWVGPWFRRTRGAFDTIAALLEVPVRAGDVAAVDSSMKITAPGTRGRIDFYSGDNPESLYGDAYHRVVIDEASRQTEASLTAALTTISSTNGKVRLAFNVERGAKNWAVRHLLRVRHLTPEQRRASGEDCMSFPTLGEGLVDAKLIEENRTKMPEALWKALYLAEIPSEDSALFRNLDELFSGRELMAPERGHTYAMGLDLARKRDWTVATVIDGRSGEIATADRFNQIEWSLQIERVWALYSRFECRKVIVDATGLGDPVAEELRRKGMRVEPFVFTGRSKKELLEGLIVACEQRQIRLPESLTVFREELSSMEYVLSDSDGEVSYGVAVGSDDCVMSLALAVKAYREGGFGTPIIKRGPPIHPWSGNVRTRGAFFSSDPTERDREDDNRIRGPLEGLEDF